MSKERLKNLIKLIAVCVMAAIITVLAIVYFVQDNAYAWFAKNEQVTASGMEVGLQVDASKVDGTTELEYYQYASEDSDGYLTFIKSENYAMQTYSSLENNVYQVIAKIKLTDEATSVTVNATTTASEYLGADTADALVANDNSLSSVVAFEIYYSDMDSSVIEEGTTSEGAATVTIKPTETPTEYSFVNNDKTLSSSVLLGETHAFTGTGSKFVYIVIKYNVNAINEIISHNIGNAVFSGDADITFKCDFSFSVL